MTEHLLYTGMILMAVYGLAWMGNPFVLYFSNKRSFRYRPDSTARRHRR